MKLVNSSAKYVRCHGQVFCWSENPSSFKTTKWPRAKPCSRQAESLRCSKSSLPRLHELEAGLYRSQRQQINKLTSCSSRKSRLGILQNSTKCTSLLNTRVGTLIVATIYLQLIQNRYVFRSFTVLQCSHQHCVQPVASDVEVVGYL